MIATMDLHDVGGQLWAEGRLEEAVLSLRQALAANPTSAKTRHALGMALLSQGNYREGWPLYDARHDVAELNNPKPSLPFPEWSGESVAGKNVLVFHEQGYGDQIMAARFTRVMRDQGADVTLLCPLALHDLFAQSLPGVRVVAAMGAVSFPDPDFWVMTSSLPRHLGVEPDTLPASPYLVAEPRVRGGIGIVTSGNPRHTNDKNRSLGPELAAALLALPGAVDLHPSRTGAKLFSETAGVVAGLDLVIAVDTSVAHLAGALGKPVLLLLPHYACDWRWMRDRDDTPWYPTAKLLRQGPDRRWEPVVEQAISTVS